MSEKQSRPPLAYRNEEFLNGPDSRALRILSEYLEPHSHFRRQRIRDTVVFFGSARIREDSPLGRYYKEARTLASLVTMWAESFHDRTYRFVVCSGGGPGIMEAANRGAMEVKGKTIGLNIGLPFAAAVRSSQELDVMVLEVSSFQLETVRTFHPQVAVWLNLSPNHLDRYPDMNEYRDAKLRIFENQTASDIAVVNAASELPGLAARRITFSAHRGDADFTLAGSRICFRGEPILDQAETKLPGIHNAENLMAALAIGHALDVEFDVMAGAVTGYTAPAHRCEFVRELDGVRWINDSKATNLDAMEMAIRSQNSPIVLIAGGKDKGFEFDAIAPLVRERVRAAVLIGEMKDRIAASWAGVACHKAATLEEAVARAAQLAAAGDTVLFSPGTSSFDMFRNYGERGNLFKAHTHQLTSKL